MKVKAKMWIWAHAGVFITSEENKIPVKGVEIVDAGPAMGNEKK